MNFRQVRKKIKTVSNVKQITKAMQMVASVKMKKAQEQALEGQTYRGILERVVSRVLKNANMAKNPFFSSKDTANGKPLYILISSNKGLCGSFNFNLFKKLFTLDYEKAGFITLGKKGADFLSRTKATILADFSKEIPFIDSVSALFSVVADEFIAGNYKTVHIIYNSFASSMQQVPTVAPLLPITALPQIEPEQKEAALRNYEIEPSSEEVLKALIVDYLQDKLRGAILESEAAEHSARMMAMKNATDNAQDLIENLTSLRNKIRQSSITSELLDATSAKTSTEVA